MITETSIEIDAPAATVWDVYADVERWPTWTESVTAVEPLDGTGLAVGRRFAITQPRFPRLIWEVTSVDAGTGWEWRQRSPGGTTLAHHRIEAIGAGRARVTQGVDQRGPIGVVVGLVVRRLTRRYLDMESQGLKSAAEARHHDIHAAS
jgi:hypothetical protein